MRSKTKTYTVLLTGEHALLRDFLRAWLSSFDYMRVVAESSNARQTLDMVKKHRPSLVLIDFDTLQGASMELLEKLRKGFPKVKVIIYFAYSIDHAAVKVMRAGAAGFVLKDAESEDMEKAIKTVMAGGVYLDPHFIKNLGAAALRKGIIDKHGKALSSLQAEMLKLVALGLSSKALATELKISAKIAGAQKKILLSRLGVKSVSALIKVAIKVGLVPA